MINEKQPEIVSKDNVIKEFVVMQDNTIKAHVKTYNEGLATLHNIQGQSWEHAMKYEGWKIKPIMRIVGGIITTQLEKMTGDGWNAINFECLDGSPLTTDKPFRHIKTGQIFIAETEYMNQARENQTRFGNHIKRGFNGGDGFKALAEEGFKNRFTELYYAAPYYWATINIETMQIFSHTEGDTAIITCGSKESFLAEASAYVECAREQFGDSAVGEWPEIKKKIEGVE